jgi:hypothetical protein
MSGQLKGMFEFVVHRVRDRNPIRNSPFARSRVLTIGAEVNGIGA